MKRIFVLLTLIALVLIGSLAQAADKVVVIPLMSSNKSAFLGED